MFSKKRSNYHQTASVSPSQFSESRSGFALIEVVVGILIMTLFIGVAMQFMVYSSLLKAPAQQYTEAMTWIQQDLEEIKYQATRYKSNSLSTAATAASASISLVSAQSFQVNDKLKIGTDPTEYTINNISGNSLTITPVLTIAIPTNAPVTVIASTRCGNTPATIMTGFADGFRDMIVGSDLAATSSDVDTNKISNRSGKRFRLRRKMSLSNIAPFNVAQVNYTVSEIYGAGAFGISVADTYAEIVPSTSFSCPE
jgi:type II secretory pathway pseudopilin PulG